MPTTTSQPASVSRRTASARWRTETAGRVRLVTSFAPIMISATSGCSASAASTCASSSRDSAPETASADQPHRALGQLGERGGDEHPGGLGGALDAQADGAGVAEDGEARAACRGRGRRRRRPRAGRPWLAPGVDVAAGGAGLLAEQGDQAAPARPTLPPPYAAPVASRRASLARVTVPPLRCRSSWAVRGSCPREVIGRSTVHPVALSPAGVTQSTDLDERGQLIVDVLVEAFSDLMAA